MNYIKRLEAEKAELQAKLAEIQEKSNNFLGHLYSDKFTGFDSNGERKDWIATKDVIGRVHEIRGIAM